MDRLSMYYPTRMIKQIGMIGEGNFCQVQKVEQVGPEGDERVAAMKACHVSNELKGTQAGRMASIEILHEARILAGFSNYTFITMFYGICFDEPIPKLIMELCPYGSVESYVTNKEVTITTAEKILIAHDIACGMQHLEECFCVHRDLAARNCLISAKGIVKVADFGLSRQARELESEKLRFNEFKARKFFLYIKGLKYE
uniref:Protein kinase domain-containing protein n=1 Tax=Panagrolaimus superbus TaxID=310955 RepID=A0A914Z6V0_9BILA